MPRGRLSLCLTNPPLGKIDRCLPLQDVEQDAHAVARRKPPFDNGDEALERARDYAYGAAGRPWVPGE